MFDLSVLPIFLTAIFFLVVSPGPDLILISSFSSLQGCKAGLMISLGVFVAGVVQTSLVAFGLGQIMESMPLVAFGVKLVGAIYLICLGVKMLRSWYLYKPCSTDKPQFHKMTNLSLINKGMLNNLLNPKALLFFSLFLPQFTSSSVNVTEQIFILGMLTCLLALVSNISFSFFFSRMGKLIAVKFAGNLPLSQHIEGFLGVVFVGLGIRLLHSR